MITNHRITQMLASQRVKSTFTERLRLASRQFKDRANPRHGAYPVPKPRPSFAVARREER